MKKLSPLLAGLIAMAASINANLDQKNKFVKPMRQISQGRTEKGNAINPLKIAKNRAKAAGMTGKQYRRAERAARRKMRTERKSLPVAN